MKRAKIVIGANFGDEGKGMMVDYFARTMNNSIVVKHNGGAQAGHTVKKDNIRFIFSHFGSGTLQNVPTYLARDFIVNPMAFRKEYDSLAAIGHPPVCFVSGNCPVTTPYDVFINQSLEESRTKRHGSCGMGIYETFHRNELSEEGVLTINELYKKVCRNPSKIHNDLYYYAMERAREAGLTLTKQQTDILASMQMWNDFLRDFGFFLDHVKIQEQQFLKNYDSLIFEGAQGLLLDQNNHDYAPHLTPSNTGSLNPSVYLKELNFHGETELVYVTRTYLTRHGEGRLDNECKKEDINPDMVDLTNLPNPWQGTLRYGFLDNFMERITEDAKNIPDGILSVAVTHLNETNGMIWGKPCDEKYMSWEEGKIE